MAGQTLLTPAEAAVLMGVNAEDLAAMRATGDGPAWGQWKGTIRYETRDVQAWMAAHTPSTEDRGPATPDPK